MTKVSVMRKLGVILAMFVLVIPNASAGGYEPSPALGAVNQIEGRSGTWISVRLPKPAVLPTPFGASNAVSAPAKGFSAFALVYQDGDEPLIVLGGRFPTDAGGSTFALPLTNLPGPSGWNYDFAKNYGNEVELPTGEYRLYVVGENPVTRFTLRLRGLRGRTSLRTDQLARASVERPEANLDVRHNLYSNGTFKKLDSRGVLFNAVWLQASAFLGGQFGFCHYTSTDFEEIAFYPGCPNADEHGFTNNRRLDPTPNQRLLFEGRPSVTAGDHGQGVWYAAESAIDSVGYLSLWIEF